jgi:hypothetical protein
VIRPFDIRDVPLVQKLHGAARPLTMQLVAVGGINPLREAMRAFVGGLRDHYVCLVERDTAHHLEAFGLMQISAESEHELPRQRGAAILLIAPIPRQPEHVTLWTYLAQELASAAAERGVHHIVAEAAEGTPEAEALLNAGFAPLMQQDLMKLTAPSHPVGAPERPEGLREATPDDAPLIHALRMRSAPRMVAQPVDTVDSLLSALKTRAGWVLFRQNELIAHVGFWHGRRGRAMLCQFRPEAEDMARDVIHFALSQDSYRRPTYCMVRHYQSGLLATLDALGFAHVTTTTLMVRHTAVRVGQPVWSAVPENGMIPVTQNRISYTLKSRRQ